MLPRPRSVFENIDLAEKDARAPVPTGMESSDTAFIGRLPAPATKEQTIERFMDFVIRAQKRQKEAWYKVAIAVSKMDDSKELLPFHMVKEEEAVANSTIEDLEALSMLYHKFRD